MPSVGLNSYGFARAWWWIDHADRLRQRPLEARPPNDGVVNRSKNVASVDHHGKATQGSNGVEYHSYARAPLTDWIIRIRAARPAHFHELRTVFGSVDVAHGFTVFDIKGNNFRLITDVDYSTGRVHIKAFFTDAEYDVWNSKMRSSKKRS